MGSCSEDAANQGGAQWAMTHAASATRGITPDVPFPSTEISEGGVGAIRDELGRMHSVHAAQSSTITAPIIATGRIPASRTSQNSGSLKISRPWCIA
jgi:hypothetical protein